MFIFALFRASLFPGSATGEDLDPGNLMVTWSPLVLAVGYTVELRPVNVGSSSSSWLSVDVTSKKLGCSSNRFDFNCSSCVVNSFLSQSLE